MSGERYGYHRVGTVFDLPELRGRLSTFTACETGDGRVVLVPAWEIMDGSLDDVVGSCVEIIARESDFMCTFLLCRATETAWVVMDYTQGYASFTDLSDWDLVHTVARLYGVFQDLASAVDVDDWLQAHTSISGVIS